MARTTLPIEAAIRTLGRMADDFHINYLLLKSIAPNSHSLPFLQAHTLELVAKCALIHAERRLIPEFLNHKVREIFRQLARSRPEILPLLPSVNAFANYRSLYIYDTGAHQQVRLPTPSLLDEYELAFLMDSLAELKYGFNKKFELTSSLHISSPDVNQRLRQLMSTTRAIYATDALNAEALSSGQKVFGSNSRTQSNLKVFLGII
jgi:hypothetical protein